MNTRSLGFYRYQILTALFFVGCCLSLQGCAKGLSVSESAAIHVPGKATGSPATLSENGIATGETVNCATDGICRGKVQVNQ